MITKYPLLLSNVQVCLNLNVMMRSLTQAAMVLAFMFAASWRLTVVTFILVPVVIMISKVGWRRVGVRVRLGLGPHIDIERDVLASYMLCCTTVSVPPLTFDVQVYGRYFASLAKKVQSELAEANGVAEEVLSSMTTVKVGGRNCVRGRV